MTSDWAPGAWSGFSAAWRDRPARRRAGSLRGRGAGGGRSCSTCRWWRLARRLGAQASERRRAGVALDRCTRPFDVAVRPWARHPGRAHLGDHRGTTAVRGRPDGGGGGGRRGRRRGVPGGRAPRRRPAQRAWLFESVARSWCSTWRRSRFYATISTQFFLLVYQLQVTVAGRRSRQGVRVGPRHLPDADRVGEVRRAPPPRSGCSADRRTSPPRRGLVLLARVDRDADWIANVLPGVTPVRSGWWCSSPPTACR